MYVRRVARMVRRQIYLTVEHDRRLREAAVRERRAEAEIVREALDRHLATATTAAVQDRSRDPLFDVVGLGSSGLGDLSKNVDRYLYGATRK